MRPTPAADLGIALDQTGRPYDNYWGPQGTTVEQRLLTRLQIDRGRLEIMDGELVDGPELVTVRSTESVNFATAEELDLRIYWQQFPNAATADSMRGDVPVRFYRPGTSPAAGAAGVGGDATEATEAIVGVELAVPGSTVARWDRFELAYQSNAGLGAVTSRLVLEVAARDFEFGDAIVAQQLPEDRPYLLADVDGEGGNDLFLFDNGAPPRRMENFQLTEGFDEDGRLVSVMLWTPRYPWRLAVEEGEPPADITEREEELIDCIEGRRLIDRWGRCT
jgi:hypothetical protein